jgi:probable rRNA maturation factor|tara:strand:- start:749 stop:1213 length:465 start_codon:yes stop_codon:yes gene_type:complete
MINVEIVSEYNLWEKNLKNPKTYIKKKLKKLTKFVPFNFRLKTFTILLTNNIKMKYLNNKFRKKNKATDVLSFPFYSVNEFKKNKEKKKYLGDIAISYQFVKNRSKLTNFELEFDKLWIHGYLHLLGYDHKKNNDYYKMRNIENKILRLIHKIN